MDGDRVYLGVDVGSASVRAGVFDDAGRRLAFAVRPIQQFRPRANFVEQSTADIWAAVCAARTLPRAPQMPRRPRALARAAPASQPPTSTTNSVPRTPRTDAGVRTFIASGDCLAILPETTASEPFESVASNRPWCVVVSNR